MSEQDAFALFKGNIRHYDGFGRLIGSIGEELNQVIEQDGIEIPWQPESHKPSLPFVICTNGKGHYWVGQYKGQEWFYAKPPYAESVSCFTHDPRINLPLAWIEPEKFVPFVKKKELHRCDHPNGKDVASCEEWATGEMIFYVRKSLLCPEVTSTWVPICPFCGYKAGEK